MNNPPGVYKYSRNAAGIARAEQVMLSFGSAAKRLSPNSVEVLVEHPLPAPALVAAPSLTAGRHAAARDEAAPINALAKLPPLAPIGTPPRPFIRIHK